MAGGQDLASANYGAADQISDVLPAQLPIKRLMSRGARRSLNIVAIVMAVLLPWFVFLLTYTSLSFDLRYHQPYIAYSFVAIGLLVVFSFLALSHKHLQNKRDQDSHVEGKWYMFIFMTSAVYWLLGVQGGNANFSLHMRPFHDLAAMNTYPDIDPSRMRGEMLMDAGKINFRNGSHLDFSRAMGIRNGRIYCVAPIVFGDNTMDHYDFWAVGMDCCAAQGAAAYHCGQFYSRNALSGVRLLRDDERPFYRLAVQQAEAKYKIAAMHPLFFTWLEDPEEQSNKIYAKGMQHCLKYLVCVFFLHLFLVVVAVLAFSKLGH